MDPGPGLTTADCAEYLGFTAEWVRQAIDDGVDVDGARVRLAATVHTVGGRRRVYRIAFDDYLAFLRAIGWSRLPLRPRAARAGLRPTPYPAAA